MLPGASAHAPNNAMDVEMTNVVTKAPFKIPSMAQEFTDVFHDSSLFLEFLKLNESIPSFDKIKFVNKGSVNGLITIINFRSKDAGLVIKTPSGPNSDPFITEAMIGHTLTSVTLNSNLSNAVMHWYGAFPFHLESNYLHRIAPHKPKHVGLVSEFINGTDVYRVTRQPQFPVKALFMFIVRMMQLFEKTSFVHNDMHSGNVLYDPSKDCMVAIDYGRCYINERLVNQQYQMKLSSNLGELYRPLDFKNTWSHIPWRINPGTSCAGANIANTYVNMCDYACLCMSIWKARYSAPNKSDPVTNRYILTYAVDLPWFKLPNMPINDKMQYSMQNINVEVAKDQISILDGFLKSVQSTKDTLQQVLYIGIMWLALYLHAVITQVNKLKRNFDVSFSYEKMYGLLLKECNFPSTSYESRTMNIKGSNSHIKLYSAPEERNGMLCFSYLCLCPVDDSVDIPKPLFNNTTINPDFYFFVGHIMNKAFSSERHFKDLIRKWMVTINSTLNIPQKEMTGGSKKPEKMISNRNVNKQRVRKMLGGNEMNEPRSPPRAQGYILLAEEALASLNNDPSQVSNVKAKEQEMQGGNVLNSRHVAINKMCTKERLMEVCKAHDIKVPKGAKKACLIKAICNNSK